MHAIDEKSPLAGYDAERLEEGDARLFLTIEARDNAIGAAVQDMRIYTAVDVLFGVHYAEAVTLDDQRRPGRRSHPLEPGRAGHGRFVS
jgi:inward rectifier potassium channel